MATQQGLAQFEIPERRQANSAQRQLVKYVLPLETFKVSATLADLPTAGDGTSLGLVAGTHGTNSPVIRSRDSGTLTTAETMRRTYTMPAEYDNGQNVQVRVYSGMFTTASDTSATVDVQVYEGDKEAGIGSDLCTTTAIDINNLAADSFEEKIFTIDGSGLVVGDTLDIEITIDIVDAATGPVVQGQIGEVALRLDIRMG